MGMKSTLTIAATVAVLSSTVTYVLISPQPSSKDIYRENQGEVSSILPRETNQKTGTFRSEDLGPHQHATTALSRSISQPSHVEASPPHKLDLQDSPGLILRENKQERDKLRRELIQSMRDNTSLSEEHIRQIERSLFADLPDSSR